MFELIIKLRYQCYIHACSGNYLGNILLLFFLSFLDFFFLCVKCPDGAPVCLEGDSGCPDDTVVSSGRSWFLFARACFAISYVAPSLDVTYVPSGR
jgi:hypothetical protein